MICFLVASVIAEHTPDQAPMCCCCFKEHCCVEAGCGLWALEILTKLSNLVSFPPFTGERLFTAYKEYQLEPILAEKYDLTGNGEGSSFNTYKVRGAR